ncbi:MAG: metallophosphoesterase [Candidatus Micrarchaeia archaeon]
MILTKDIELIDGLPIAYIKSLDAFAIADMHLGYEGVMAKTSGTAIPKVNLKYIKDAILEALKKHKAKQLIIDGDIKNEFSKVDEEEFNELYDFINFAKTSGLSLTLIKGNHDNFVDKYKEPFKLTIYTQEAKLGNYLFFHGEELPKNIEKTKMLIMGHEHPGIGIKTMAGSIERVKCFLFGKYFNIPILVLPAISYFASSSDINMKPKNELLAPVFKNINVDSMHAIAVGYGATIDFGKIKDLKM